MKYRKVELKMATQMAETPVLSGEDARKVLEELKIVPTNDQKKKLREKRAARFAGVRRERT